MIRLVHGEWSKKSQEWLSHLAWDEESIFVSLQNDIRDAIQYLYYAFNGDGMVGCCTVRFEQHSNHKEMCVTALAGNPGSVFLMMDFEPCLVVLAQRNKCTVIRGHVKRVGLKKHYEKAGYCVREILKGEWVMTRDVCLD